MVFSLLFINSIFFWRIRLSLKFIWTILCWTYLLSSVESFGLPDIYLVFGLIPRFFKVLSNSNNFSKFHAQHFNHFLLYFSFPLFLHILHIFYLIRTLWQFMQLILFILKLWTFISLYLFVLFGYFLEFFIFLLQFSSHRIALSKRICTPIIPFVALLVLGWSS